MKLTERQIGRGAHHVRCRHLTWTISGTDRAPELFAVLGDPDAGDVRILERASS
ncbi:hypothetical protein [Streptomyces antibioticus]|uniref:hypothetical protein n=1 Tax=Streptomyces antibioticus TaxID=1890 RepID=UPI0033F8FA34